MAKSSRPPAGDEPPPPEIVAGKYRLTGLIGRGGMGSVWEGMHITLGTRVAIKFIEAQFVHQREARMRFENEARAAAALNSRHVVQVFDHGMTEDGRPYIVMEFLSGEPLDRRLERVGRLGPAETARLVVQICRALSKAHQAGIIHRDLKPENVFLVWDAEENADVTKVVDFGIAKFADRSTLTSATRTGSVLGTPYYMSPEQARGLRTVDHRSDLWSVGVIAYQCLVGQLPFQGESVGDLLVTICTGTLPIPSREAGGLPPAFDAWFARALARSPDDRFQSAPALAESLCEAMGISPQGDSWGTAAARLSSGVMTPSTMSSGGSAAVSVPVTPQATPGSVTLAAAAGKRFPAARIAIAAAAVVGLGVVGWLKLSSAGGQPAVEAPHPEAARPVPAANPLPVAAATVATPAVPSPVEVTPSPAAITPPSETPPSVTPEVNTMPRGNAPSARAPRAARAFPASNKPSAQPAQPAAEPTPPAPQKPAEPAAPARPAKPAVDIDKDDPWRK